MSFYKFTRQYPHRKPERVVLVRKLTLMVEYITGIKEIVSFTDLMAFAKTLPMELSSLEERLDGDLWQEYCATVGRPFSEGDEAS